MFCMVTVFAAFAASVSALDPATCTAGETVVEQFIKLQCIRVGNVAAIGCVAPNEAEMAIGQTTNDDHFRYICVRDGETVRFYATGIRIPYFLKYHSNLSFFL